jgi:hypothetical protein
MSDLDKATETQINNIEAKTGQSLSALTEIINASPLTKHSDLREMIIKEFNLGYGDANLLVHIAKKSAGPIISDEGEKSIEAVVSEIYSGKNASLISIHDEVMKRIQQLGDFEIAPKKKYLSLRRKKQFAMLGPGTKNRVELGLNMKGLEGTNRLESLPPGGMCQYRVFISNLSDVDDVLMSWIKTAYDSAG